MQLSIVIPAYKEETRIERNLLEIKDYVQERGITDFEVVVVIDGSPDDTAGVVERFRAQLPEVRIINNAENRGKGAVVRQGLLAATGDTRVFMDADGSTSISHLGAAQELLAAGADLVVGSRDVQGAQIQVRQPKWRELLGDTGNWLIRGVLGLWAFPDTQCGFKVMTGEAAEALASRMVVDRFGFDFEMIALAKRLEYNIAQLPVRWINDDASTVTLFGPNGYAQVVFDLLRTRWRIMTGAYNISKHTKK